MTKAVIWSREESKERFPLPISPMGWSLLQAPTEVTVRAISDWLGTSPFSANDLVKNIDGYIYGREKFFGLGILLKIRLIVLIRWLMMLLLADLRQLLISPFDSRLVWYDRIPFFGFIGSWTIFLLKSPRSIGVSLFDSVHSVFQFLFCRIYQIKIEAVLADWSVRGPRIIDELRSRAVGDPLTPISAQDFLTLRKKMEKASCDFFYHDFNVFFLKNLLHRWLCLNLQLAGKTKSEAIATLNDWSQGLSGNFSVQMALDFANLPSVNWLQKYGHLTDNWDVMAPILSDNPKIWQQSLIDKNLNQLHQNKTRNREKLVSLITKLFQKDSQILHQFKLFEALVLLDEDLRAFSSLQFPNIKALFQRVTCTASWQEAGLAAQDIYFMTITEAEQGLTNNSFSFYRDLIAARKIEFAKSKTKNPPDRIMENGELKALPPNNSPPEKVMKGQAISQGQKEAPVLLINSMEDLANFKPGHILVLRSPNPTYAPYYTFCGGILSETGGVLSHGALVAREFGIPMISGLPNLFRDLRDHDVVAMDGTLGEVQLIRRP
jgi:phosphohistidine swiveling domain-containing protein